MHKAWVVFTAHRDVWWLKFLKRGYGHCWLLINDGKCWTSIDSRLNTLEIANHHHLGMDFDMIGWLEKHSTAILRADIFIPSLRAAPFGIMSCTEMAKRYLGIRSMRVQTPWQLAKYLHKQGENQCEIKN